MLFSSFLSNPLSVVIYMIVLVITIAVHEYAHARVADELGDPTARLSGRLTLNPKAHIDPMGLILLFFIGFGWGKPVPFDPYNLRNPRRDSALISLAGPASNFFIAISGAIVLRLLNLVELSILHTISYEVVSLVVYLNILLGIFNLLPFAPLDGFKIVGGLLSDEQAHNWYSLERYGIIFLLVFIFPLVGSRSMLEILVRPVIMFVSGVLIP